MGRGQLPHQLRPGDQHADPGAGRLGLRSRPRQCRQEQFRPAHRRRLQPRRQDRRPRRLRHRATCSSTGWAARTCCRSTDRTWCAITIVQQPSQGMCVGNQAPTTLLPHDPARLSRRADGAGQLQPAQRARQLHPAGQHDRQHPELAPHVAARAAEPLRRRCRVCRQPEPQPDDPRRLQPGAAERDRARTSPCRPAVRSRAISSSRPPSTAARATTGPCR